jgi:hypothetical protein
LYTTIHTLQQTPQAEHGRHNVHTGPTFREHDRQQPFGESFETRDSSPLVKWKSRREKVEKRKRRRG